MQISFTISQINKVAKQILTNQPQKIILFNGEMGAGKTTLIKELCAVLGVKNATSSPTFSIVNEYQIDNNTAVYHFDLYRLKSSEEALDMGIDDVLYSKQWCFIEWSEKIIELIPEKHSIVQLSVLDDGTRTLEMN
jgi:tRNA threonylcarbamoyladenosine biosynthesis protein TsaE